jgi:hypothetical protein
MHKLLKTQHLRPFILAALLQRKLSAVAMANELRLIV